MRIRIFTGTRGLRDIMALFKDEHFIRDIGDWLTDAEVFVTTTKEDWDAALSLSPALQKSWWRKVI